MEEIMNVATFGIDVGKTWFNLIGLGSRGAVVARERNPYPKHQALPSATEEALDVGF
jgi:hypothetical protein